jgi:putative transposase
VVVLAPLKSFGGDSMTVEMLRSAHSVGESNLHLQFTPAYRRDVFSQEIVRILTRDYILAASKRMKIEILAIGFGDDHVHVFIRNWKNFSIVAAAKRLKGFSSRMMRKHHFELFCAKLYKKKFWSAGYFYRTVGVVNASTVERYVKESQQYSYEKSDAQKKLIEFFSHDRRPPL